MISKYSHQMQQSYQLILRSKDKASGSTNEDAMFYLKWVRNLDKNKTYHMVVQSFNVIETGDADSTLVNEVYEICVNEPFQNIYSTLRQGSTSALVVARGGSFTTPNQSVGGTVDTPTFMSSAPLNVSFKRIVDGAAPAAIANPDNVWVMTLLLFPVD
jgi:hypothetical protein